MHSFVCATAMDTAETYRFRSHALKLDVLENVIKIWEAVVATMALPTYFDPIAIGPYGSKFIDGGIGANNPLRILLQEARRSWTKEAFEDELGCIVSIGSGMVSMRGFGGNLPNVTRGLADLITESEREAEYFPRDHPSLASVYFRFNVHHGLENARLEEWRQMNVVHDATANYVKNETTRAELLACGELLRASRTWPWSDIKDLDENYPVKSAGDAFATSPSFSDSGYSTGSSFFKSDLEHTKAEEDLFNVLTKDSELEPLYPVAIREIGSARFQKNLILLLKRYCGWLRIVAHTEFEKATVKFMRVQVRPMAVRITNHFRMNEHSHRLAPLLDASRSQGPRVNMVQKYLDPISTDPVEEEERTISAQKDEKVEGIGEAEEGGEAEDEGALESPIEGTVGYLRDFLVSGEPFNSLRKDFWRFAVQKSETSKPSLLASKLPSQIYVQNALEPWFPSKFHQRHRLKINIYWEVLDYLQKELDEGQSLKALLTLSGGKENAFAATCDDYLEWLCPKSSQVLLEALLDALELNKTNSTGISRHFIYSIKSDSNRMRKLDP